MTSDPSWAFDEMKRSRPDDPFIQWRVDPRRVELVARDGDHIAWTSSRRDGTERWATVLGDDAERAGSLLGALHGLASFDGVTIHESASEGLASKFRAPQAGHWCLWALDRLRITPALSGWAARASILDPEDQRINELLRHSDSAHVFAGDPRIHRWAGVVIGGELVAVAGQELEASGAAHLVSVCCDPGHRGRGYARAACARLILDVTSDGCPAIILEMYAANEAGRAVYSALGFIETGRYRSGLLVPVTLVLG